MYEWKGKPFVAWCKNNPDDDRKINYYLHVYHWCEWCEDWEENTFSNEDGVSLIVLHMLRESIVRSIRLIDGEWHAELEYYAIP